MTWTRLGLLVVSSTDVTLAYCRRCHKNSRRKSYRCPKFDGDSKQILEIRVQRKRNNRSKNMFQFCFALMKVHSSRNSKIYRENEWQQFTNSKSLILLVFKKQNATSSFHILVMQRFFFASLESRRSTRNKKKKSRKKSSIFFSISQKNFQQKSSI